MPVRAPEQACYCGCAEVAAGLASAAEPAEQVGLEQVWLIGVRPFSVCRWVGPALWLVRGALGAVAAAVVVSVVAPVPVPVVGAAATAVGGYAAAWISRSALGSAAAWLTAEGGATSAACAPFP